MRESRDLYKVIGDSVIAVPISSIIPQTYVGVFSPPESCLFRRVRNVYSLQGSLLLYRRKHIIATTITLVYKINTTLSCL